MRVYLLILLITALSFYALKDYYKPTLFLILMMAFYGHPDMPSNVAGIQGLNPWNILMLFCVVGYLVNKRKEGLFWDLPPGTTLLLVLYVFFSILSSTRLMLDFESLKMFHYSFSRSELISEYFVNQNKWLVPAFLIVVGARTVERRWWALAAIIGVHVLVALITIRRIPLDSVTSGMELTLHGLKVLEQAFGWSRVNTAMLLAGGAWAALFATGYLIRHQPVFEVQYRLNWLPATLFAVTSIALALTGGRMGWGAWAAIALFVTLWKWRKGIILIPALVVTLIALVPAVKERLLQGLSVEGDTTVENLSEVTSGRTAAWPIVVDKIVDRPMLGYGGLAMLRTGAEEEVRMIAQIPEGERGFPHPHNAYLRILFDSGIVGTIPILWLYFLILYRSYQICGPPDPEARAIGMTTIALFLALMVAGIGSQNLFPVQGNIALWAAAALTLRVHTDRFYGAVGKRGLAVTDTAEGTTEDVTGLDLEDDEEATPLWQKARRG